MSPLLQYVRMAPELIDPEDGSRFQRLLFECPLLDELCSREGSERELSIFRKHILFDSPNRIVINKWDPSWGYQIGLNTASDVLLSDDLEFLLSFYSDGFIRENGSLYDAGIEIVRFGNDFFLAELDTSNWRVVFSLVSEKSARHIATNFVSKFLVERINRALSIGGIDDKDRYDACLEFLSQSRFRPFNDAAGVAVATDIEPVVNKRRGMSF